MNYYIDFDNTLYETAKLTSLIIDNIASSISKNTQVDSQEVLEEIKENFNSTYDNIYNFTINICKKYKIDSQETISSIENIIKNGRNIVFDDAKRFLKRLKEKGHNICLLTYVAKENEEYQLNKIVSSGLCEYFDEIIITSKMKFELDIDYKNGIFIDDDPRDLKGLYEKNPIKVIRIRKKNNKRFKIDIDNENIEEYESFDDIDI